MTPADDHADPLLETPLLQVEARFAAIVDAALQAHPLGTELATILERSPGLYVREMRDDPDQPAPAPADTRLQVYALDAGDVVPIVTFPRAALLE
jgi:hypothetical protein